MELIVPTSFDEGLLRALPPYPVRYIYGSLPGEPSARAGRWLPPVDQEQLAEHIRVASLELPSGLPLRDVLEKIARAQGDRLRQAGGSLDERLPVSGTVPIKILVLNTADG